MPLKILVAGGAGFIGSNLCERLVLDGHHVTAVDNLITGRARNIESLLPHPRFQLVQADIIGPQSANFARHDRIYHLASPASPPGYQRFAVETLRVNSEGTRNLLELASRHDARILYASTSEAYGDPLEHPQRETYRGNVSSTGPRSMYDEAKRFGEALTMVYARNRGVDARVVRIFNTYGPRSDPYDGRLVPNMVTQALRGDPVTVYGDGLQTRSLCYVDDLVEGLIRTMEASSLSGEVLNLGNPQELTVLDYARLILSLTQSRSPLAFRPPAVGDDPQRRRPDITKAQGLLGWSPGTPLEAGLAKTIRYFAQELALVPPPGASLVAAS